MNFQKILGYIQLIKTLNPNTYTTVPEMEAVVDFPRSTIYSILEKWIEYGFLEKREYKEENLNMRYGVPRTDYRFTQKGINELEKIFPQLVGQQEKSLEQENSSKKRQSTDLGVIWNENFLKFEDKIRTDLEATIRKHTGDYVSTDIIGKLKSDIITLFSEKLFDFFK